MRWAGAALLLAPLVLSLGAAPAHAQAVGHQAILLQLDGASFEDLLSVPQFRGLASEGGAGILSERTSVETADGELVHPPDGFGPAILLPGLSLESDSVLGPGGVASARSLRGQGARLATQVSASAASDLLVIVVSTPPPASLAAGDQLGGIVLASGSPVRLAQAMAGTVAPPRSLTSDSTRRSGVVSTVDVPATILAFLHAPPRGTDLGGSAIRVTDAPAPFDLHARYLGYRRMTVPIQTAAGIWVTLAGLLGIAMLASRARRPARFVRFGALLTATLVPLSLFQLLAGHLRTISYATVVPFILVGTIGGTLLFGAIERTRGPQIAFAWIGILTLLAFAAEAALGWSATLTPFLGGGELDGGRFYGLPNVDIGLLLGSSVFVASRVREPLAGAAIIAATGLFAGLPWTGANLGGSITVFAAAALWFGIRRSGRLGVREVASTLAIMGVGTLLVLLAHRYLVSAPTHITRFVEGRGGGLIHTALDRLDVGLRLMARNPFALVPILGVPVFLAAALWPPAPLCETFDAHPEWRHVVMVILLASIVAYFANDSGAAALGLGFGSAVSAMLAVPLLERAGKMEA